MDFNITFVISTSSSGHFNVLPALPTRSLNYFLICLAFFIFCPLFYILCRFVKLLCFPGKDSSDATAFSANAEPEENSGIGVYVIDIDFIQGYIRNSETSISDSQNCFGSATPYESRTRLSCVLSPSQIPQTCPSYGELYDLDSPPPTYEEWESKTGFNPIPPATESPLASKAAPPHFPRLQFEQLYRNLVYFAFYMFYRLKRFV